jgi:tRNA dimethylallyltransferase
MTHDRPSAIFLMGPSASGKTALAVDWAARWPVELISVDSALVYRGLDIGSAKPDAATLARAPHRLVDIRDPEQPYSAAEFRADALDAMAEISAHGRVPLLVGGTMLYFRALERGLSDLPSTDPATRARINARLAAEGSAALHAELVSADPVAAKRIHPNDPQRIGRALEVIALTGRPLSEQQGGARARLPWRVLKIALMPTRECLHERADRRFRQMLADGLVDEVRRLRERPALTADAPSMRAVGYRQAWEFTDGAIDEPALIATGIAATRQLIKRQVTWLRAELDAFQVDPEAAGSGERIRQLVADFL